MLNRRHMLAGLSCAPALQLAGAAAPEWNLCIHQTTSSAAGYRRSLEGYARAGIKHVEIIAAHVDAFVKTDGLPAAKRLLSDLGLTPVSHGGFRGLWEPLPARAKALEDLKHHGEVAAGLGIDRMVGPSGATAKFTLDDYKAAATNAQEAGEIAKQFGVTLMVEFNRSSTFISTLPTALRIIREAAHPNVKTMLDFYHYWAGLSKFEDLESIRPGEIHHTHFQDVPDMPRELLTNTTREIPGLGVTPIARILQALRAKGYSGAFSVELFYPKYQTGDPYDVARAIREKAEPYLKS
jgi:2-keto-myo-inositol isomerase